MKENKEQKVIIQHYIPQCVLKNFSNENDQVYEGLVMEKKSYLTNVSNSMAERFTYEHALIEVNILEKFFGRIESYIGPAFTRIIDALEKNDGSIKDIKRSKSLIDKYMREFLIFYYRSGALLHEFAHEQKIPEDRVLLLMRKLVSSDYIIRLSETVLNNYLFCLLKNNEGNFILSDQFISTAALGVKNRFANVSNRQIGLKQVILLIPISKKYYAVYFHGKAPIYIRENKINELNTEQLRVVNKVIVNNSYKKSVAYNKDSLDFALSKFEFRSPVTIVAGYKSGATTGTVIKKEIFFYEDDEEIMDFFESTDWLKFESLERNDVCLCGSKKKFKKCHMNLTLECKRMIDHIKNNGDSRIYNVSEKSTVELPINEWYGYVPPEKQKTN
jgi:uncharacterized protein YchJ